MLFLTKTAKVTPVVDFKHLKEVLVITDLKKTKIVIDGDVFDLNQGEIINYNRKLLMKDG